MCGPCSASSQTVPAATARYMLGTIGVKPSVRGNGPSKWPRQGGQRFGGAGRSRAARADRRRCGYPGEEPDRALTGWLSQRAELLRFSRVLPGSSASSVPRPGGPRRPGRRGDPPGNVGEGCPGGPQPHKRPGTGRHETPRWVEHHVPQPDPRGRAPKPAAVARQGRRSEGLAHPGPIEREQQWGRGRVNARSPASERLTWRTAARARHGPRQEAQHRRTGDQPSEKFTGSEALRRSRRPGAA
jgi:hypothetical protein